MNLKRIVRRVVRRFGYDVVRPQAFMTEAFAHHLRTLFATLQIECVVDVGANKGQYRQWLRDTIGYQGWILSFEPVGAQRG